MELTSRRLLITGGAGLVGSHIADLVVRESPAEVVIDDVARANVLAVQSDASDEVFNVASGVETSLEELAYALLGVMNSPLRPEYRPAQKVNAVLRRLAATARAHKRLGFGASVSLDEGLRRLAAWWKAETGALART